MYAWQIAHLLQQRAQGLVVINGVNIKQMARRFKNPAQVAKSWYIFLMQLPKLPEILLQRMGSRLLRLAYYLGKLPREFQPPKKAAMQALVGAIPQYRAFVRESLQHVRQRLPLLQCPTLVIWGKNDLALVPPTMDELEAEVVKPVVRMLEAGHWVHREKSAEVNHIIEKFISARHSQ